jgi:hypothetical protein
VSGNKLIIKGAGTATITASQAGNGEVAPAVDVTQSQVILATQTISFGALANTPFVLNGEILLTATASSGLPVTYTSSDLDIVKVLVNKLVMTQYSGTVTITASQAGNGEFAPAVDVTQSQFILSSQTISFDALESKPFVPNGEILLTASADSLLPVTYASSDDAVVLVSGNKLIIKGAGTATITASQGGNVSYTPATNVTQSQVITKASQTISFDLSPVQFLLDNEITLFAIASSGLPVTYTSSDDAVVKVSGNTLIMKKVGMATITASQAGNNNYDIAISVTRSQFVILTFTNSATFNTYQGSFQVAANTYNPDVSNINIVIPTMTFSSTTGVAYGINTGLTGVVGRVSITATKANTDLITDFSSSPITLNLQLPNANQSKTLKMYKLNPGKFQKMTNQPIGFPVNVTYVNNKWTCQLPSLSEFAIIDEELAQGTSGGDPHVKSILNDKVITLPNEWKLVKLYESNNILVVAEAKFISHDIVSNMHHMDGQEIDLEKDRYVLDYTYFVNVKIYKNNTVCLVVNTVNGEIEYDNKTIVHDKNNSVSIYSFLHKKHYENKNACNYMIYLNDSNRLEVTVDNYWLDLNSFNLYINDMATVSEYKGELVYHDFNNCLEYFE